MRKSHIVSMLVLVAIINSVGVYTFNMQKNNSTEFFIETHFINDNGTIATYITEDPGYVEEDWAAIGQEALSESTGLYLSYLLLSNKRSEFKAQVDTLKTFFLNEEGFIYWKIGPLGEKISSSNSLIDDLRIMKTLYSAGEKFSDITYHQLAERIKEFILHKQLNEGYLVSFYEQEYDLASDEIMLSYIDLEALEYFPKEITEKLKTLLLENQNSVFYPQRYNLTMKEFEWNEEIHLIDQILIAQQLQLINGNVDPFVEFIRESFEKDGRIYGKYDRTSGNPTVDYESTAVYGLLIPFFLSIDKDFSRELYDRLMLFRSEDGGYTVGENGHFFDNILPLLAETTLLYQ